MADSDIPVNNYCVGFLDLLGMTDAMKDQGLIPPDSTSAEHQAFVKSVRDSVGVIRKLQNYAVGVQEAEREFETDSPIANQFTGKDRQLFDEMRRMKVTMQTWSDGLIYFSNLGDPEQKCRTNAIFHILGTAGGLYLFGLAMGHPLRGGIDIAWAAELEPGKLSGAALARAYELESSIAQYPRIVVHERVAACLQSAIENPDNDVYSQNDRGLAQVCLNEHPP